LLDGGLAKLGGRAFDVLLALIERNDRPVSKNELLEVVS
jgi:DNA-binding winged helix-turn-helix (wHTH) protein